MLQPAQREFEHKARPSLAAVLTLQRVDDVGGALDRKSRRRRQTMARISPHCRASRGRTSANASPRTMRWPSASPSTCSMRKPAPRSSSVRSTCSTRGDGTPFACAARISSASSVIGIESSLPARPSGARRNTVHASPNFESQFLAGAARKWTHAARSVESEARRQLGQRFHSGRGGHRRLSPERCGACDKS